MTVNDIIVLENDERYTLLEETIKDGEKYFLAASIDDDENIDSNKLVLLKLDQAEDGDYVEIVNDEKLIIELSKKITDAKK